jgi:hypothetical protein
LCSHPGGELHLKRMANSPAADPRTKSRRPRRKNFASHRIRTRIFGVTEAKLILPHEVERLLKADSKTPHESTWTPILWAVKLLQRARSEGKIQMEPAIFTNLISSIDGVESSNRKILNYGWINFPLAYTQVATLSVFCYFMAAVFGRQYLIPREVNLDTESFPHLNISYSNTEPFDNHTPDFYFPVFTYVELLSYMGWIKVAETLLNPFGDDDEDFQVNYMIDRNLQVSYLIVDEAEEEMDMAEDPFMEAGIAIPKDLPGYVNKSFKAPMKSGDSMDLAPIEGQNSGSGTGKLIFHRFRSLRLRRKQQDMLSAAGAAKSLEMRHEGILNNVADVADVILCGKLINRNDVLFQVQSSQSTRVQCPSPPRPPPRPSPAPPSC